MLLSVLMACVRSVNVIVNEEGEPGMLRVFSLSVECVVAPVLIRHPNTSEGGRRNQSIS